MYIYIYIHTHINIHSPVISAPKKPVVFASNRRAGPTRWICSNVSSGCRCRCCGRWTSRPSCACNAVPEAAGRMGDPCGFNGRSQPFKMGHFQWIFNGFSMDLQWIYGFIWMLVYSLWIYMDLVHKKSPHYETWDFKLHVQKGQCQGWCVDI